MNLWGTVNSRSSEPYSLTAHARSSARHSGKKSSGTFHVDDQVRCSIVSMCRASVRVVFYSSIAHSSTTAPIASSAAFTSSKSRVPGPACVASPRACTRSRHLSNRRIPGESGGFHS